MEQNGFVCAAPDNANKMFTPLFASSYSPLFSFPNLVLVRYFFSLSLSGCACILFVLFDIIYIYRVFFTLFLCFYLIVLILFSFEFFVSLVACTAQACIIQIYFILWLLCIVLCECMFFNHFAQVS